MYTLNILQFCQLYVNKGKRKIEKYDCQLWSGDIKSVWLKKTAEFKTHELLTRC